MQTKQIGEGLMRLRRQAGLSQEELGAKIGVTRQAVSKWEGGAALPSVDNIVELARVLNVSVDALLQLETKADAPGLSAEGVGRMLDAYARQDDRRFARLTRILIAAIVALGLGVGLSAGLNAARTARLQSAIDERLSGVDQRISTLSNGISAQIAASIDGALAERTTMLADGGCRSIEYDFEADAVIVHAFAYPREMRTEEAAEFFAIGDDGARYACPAEVVDGGYEAALRVPSKDDAELPLALYVHVQGEGAAKTELIEQLNVDLDALRTRVAELWVDYQWIEGSLTLRPHAEVRLARGGDFPASWPESARVQAYAGERLLLESALTQIEEQGAGITPFATTWEGEMSLGDVQPAGVRVVVTVIDNLGHEFTREVALDS